MPAGRPTTYSQDIADTICRLLSEGTSLRKICIDDSMPATSTVFRWLSLYPEFQDQYARARELQADAIFDEMLHLADTPQIGKKTKRTGKGKGATVEETSGDMIEHRRLQIETRKWMAAKLRPKKYGDKLDLAVSGSLQTMPEDQLNARITELLGKAGASHAADGAGQAEPNE